MPHAWTGPFEAESLAELAIKVISCELAPDDEAKRRAPQLHDLASPAHLLHPKPEQRMTLPALQRCLREQAGASGVNDAQLIEGHPDCAEAARVTTELCRKMIRARRAQLNGGQ